MLLKRSVLKIMGFVDERREARLLEVLGESHVIAQPKQTDIHTIRSEAHGSFQKKGRKGGK